MKCNLSVLLKSTAVVLTIALFPGCAVFDLFKKKDDKADEVKAAGSDTMLCKINDKVVITKDDFDKRISQILQANPYFRGAGADMLPPQVKQNVFKRLVEEELLIHDADSNKIEQDAEFKKIYAEMKNLLKRSVKIQLTEKKVFDKIQISDEEISENFEKNKDRYVKVAGGVLVSGVKFDNDAAAIAFLATAKAKLSDFEALAKKSKVGKFKEFGRVSKESAGMGMEAVPAPIKDFATTAANLPAVHKVKVGKEFWVVKASDRKAPVYFELSEIKEQLVGMLKNNKFKDEYSKVVKDLQDKYKVTTNDDFFKAPEAEPKDAAVAGEENIATEEPATKDSANDSAKPAAGEEQVNKEAEATTPA